MSPRCLYQKARSLLYAQSFYSSIAKVVTEPVHPQTRMLTSTLHRPLSLACTNWRKSMSTLHRPVSLACTKWRKSMRSYPIPTTRLSIHMLSMFDLHVPDSTLTHYDDLGTLDHQVKPSSTASRATTPNRFADILRRSGDSARKYYA
jgi:hypothetical protein